MQFIFVLALMSTLSANADFYKDKCADLKECVSYVAKLTGDHYTYEVDLKGKLEASSALEINARNADLLLTQMLDANGYTRVPLNTAKTYTIMRTRDARDTLLPKVTANAKFEPVLPNTWDWYDMQYEVTHPTASAEMTRLVRNFMPPNSRVIALDASSKVIVTGPVPVLRRVYILLKDLDRPTSKKKD